MNPYEKLTERAFWRPSVADRSCFDIAGLWDPKFELTAESPIATFGSCFAQHIGLALARRGFHWLVTEPGPRSLPADRAREYGYGVFSARTGNIYTTSLLNQWVRWAAGKAEPPATTWRVNGRHIDPFRPRVEPDGFETEDELLRSRNETIAAFRASIEQAECFVFTLGLTERWYDAESGLEYPICPGAVSDSFSEDVHLFEKQRFGPILANLEGAIETMRTLNPSLRFLLTVSPVPLVATYSGNHVLAATMESKSVLRAVAAEAADSHEYVDYFPSYEMIASPAFRGTFFEPNMRAVSSTGVNFVMGQFFSALRHKFDIDTGRPVAAANGGNGPEIDEMELQCEEELLAGFGGSHGA